MKKITFLLCIFAISVKAQTVAVSTFATGFSGGITEITHAGDQRLFVNRQSGHIRILNPDGSVNPTDFLNVTSLISTGGERGLLGLAFHPDYATNGYFYIDYTNTNGDTVIARYHVSPDPNVADASSGLVMLTVSQPYSNHNGGTLRFGPDGYLYIGMGDGGSGGDPGNRAQNINVNLGKLLRLDVNADAPYFPASNPYAGVDGSDAVWAIGLRNPWKWSFDKLTGDLWIADVGQDSMEEIDHVTGNGGPGLNYGWKCYEGTNVYTAGCAQPGVTYTMPVYTYTHGATGGCSITGGFVYRGAMYPNFTGKFFFGDYCLNRIGYLDGTTATYTPTISSLSGITTFGQDVNGELYVGAGSTVFKIYDSSLGVNQFASNGLSLMPNPTSGTVYLHNASGRLLSAFSLRDISGKLLLRRPLDQDSPVNAIAIGALQTGIYIATVEDRSGNLFTSKLSVK
jgi:glucose/arabinose dehydrogenase